jgi:hypothetical protein
MAFGQSFLHKAVCLFCRTKMSDNDGKGCSEGVPPGLRYGEDVREGIQEEAASEVSSSSASCNRER